MQAEQHVETQARVSRDFDPLANYQGPSSAPVPTGQAAVHAMLRRLLSSVLFATTLAGQNADAERLLASGRAKALEGQFRAALVDLDAGIAAAPEHAELRRWRGHCRNALGQHTEAEADYDIALRLDPQSSWAFYARGMARFHLGRHQEAIADYSQSLRLDPKRLKAWLWRGFNQAQLGNFLAAWLDFDQGLKLQPDNTWTLAARARAAAALGARRRCRQDLQAWTRLAPKDAEAWAQLGFHEAEGGDTAAALAAFARACETGSKPDPYLCLWSYWLNGGKVQPGRPLPEEGFQAQLAEVLRGELDAAGIRKVAREHEDAVKPRATCIAEAEFYLGLHRLLAGQREAAAGHFRRCLAQGGPEMPEWRAARHILR